MGCGVGSAQYNWLKADLAATQQNCILAYWHHPLENLPASGRALWTLLYNAGVDFVLVGHQHVYRAPRAINPNGSSDANGPREVIVGTGGRMRELAQSTGALLHILLLPCRRKQRAVAPQSVDQLPHAIVAEVEAVVGAKLREQSPRATSQSGMRR